MDKAMRECPHPNIRVAAQLNYTNSQQSGLVKPEVRCQAGGLSDASQKENRPRKSGAGSD
jgi:hypothetical protein